MIKVEIYTDGSCNQAAKTGGWSFIILEDNNVKQQKSGHEIDTTNNQCEMIAAIKAMEELGATQFLEPINVIIYSDSAYLVNAFNQCWISTWLNNGWLNSNREPVANKELWESLIGLQLKYKTEFVHIKRRSNELAKRVDDMAKKPII